MIVEVTMPILGLTMEQGTIVAWLKAEGDQVTAGDPLFMVETDKATSDAPSPASGTLGRILAQEGETVPVGQVIAYLGETPEDVEQLAATTVGSEAALAPGATADVAAISWAGEPDTAAAQGRTQAARPALAAAPVDASGSPGRVLASPRARARARALGIDLDEAAPGSARLTEKDVITMAASAPATPEGPMASARAERPPGSRMEAASEPPIQKLSRARRIIAERMTLSATTVPQVTYTLRCDVSEAMTLRRSLKTNASGERTAVSLEALIVRAAALALAAFPQVNSQWVEGEGIRILPQINIAVAVDLDERGLVIPVVHDADRLDIRATAAEIDRLTTGARANKLGPDDYAGGTFTISSLASAGVESFNPIVVPPQVAILGVGAILPTPVFQQDQVVKRRLMALSLTTDHRVLDGAPSARFLSRIRDLLEQPARLAK